MWHPRPPLGVVQEPRNEEDGEHDESPERRGHAVYFLPVAPFPELAGGVGGADWLVGAGGGLGGCLPPFFSKRV